MTPSLKWRLVGLTIGGMALLLAVFAVVVYTVIERALRRGFDDNLAVTAWAIAASAKQEKATIEVEFDDGEMPEFRRADRPAYFELWCEDGRVLRRSSSLGERDLERRESAPGTPAFYPLALPDKRPGRAVALRFRPKVEDEQEGEDKPAAERASAPPVVPQNLTLVVARGTAGLDRDLAMLRWLLAGAAGGTILLALLVAAATVRQGLRPLDALAAGIAAIREDNLAAALPEDRMPAEMVPVVSRLNELLARLEAAFQRERALTADVAHELRTPLAGMRSTMEVALSRVRAAGDYQQALRDCLAIVGQTQAMADNLLALARLEGGQTVLCAQEVRVAELVEAAWRPHVAAARARGIALESRLPADLEATADRDTLAMVLANLLANAAEYTDDGGRIEIGGWSAGDHVELAIANTGCRLTPEEAAHVFDRFWRGDAARAGTGIHCGLGLTLVQRGVAALGGTVAVKVDGGVFAVALILPAPVGMSLP
jgi:two-component system sensor histidine kinase QseC